MALVIREVKFTAVSRRQLNDTVDYIFKEFGFLVAEKFINTFERKLKDIAAGKIVHRYFLKSKQIRYFIFNSKNYVLYKELPSAIVITGVYNFKRNMASIRKRLDK